MRIFNITFLTFGCWRQWQEPNLTGPAVFRGENTTSSPNSGWIPSLRGWLHETGMNSDGDEVRSLQRHYMRPGRKSRVITWDRHEMRRLLKVFHIQSTFSMLHIGRWPFRYEPNHHGRSSTAGHVLRNVSFCNGMCYTFKCFFCFPFAIWEQLQTFAHARPLT